MLSPELPAPFDELDALWHDHLINVRELRIGHLEIETARDLLMKPIPDFPDGAVPREVAEAILARTGGQPFLVQLYGPLLVERLNEAKRREAELDDVAAVEKRVLSSDAVHYFRNCYDAAPADGKTALQALASGRAPGMDRPTRHWLHRRLLIDESGHFCFPVLGAWIRQELGLL